MISKKYVGDYKIIYDVNGKGKLQAKAEYVAAQYGFTINDDQRQAAAKRFVLLLFAAAAAWLIPLLFFSPAARLFYVIVPHVGAAFALYVVWQAVGDFKNLKAPLRREQSEKLESRFKSGTLAGMFLFLVASIGCVVGFIFAGAFATSSCLVLICDISAFICLAVLWQGREKTRTVKTAENTELSTDVG